MNDLRVFEGENCISEMFKRLQLLEGEPMKINRNAREFIAEYEMNLSAHDGSGFDNWIIMNNLPPECRNMNLNKNGKE